jgi:hypothetical protein
LFISSLNTVLSSADVVREVKPSMDGDLEYKARILKYLIVVWRD